MTNELLQNLGRLVSGGATTRTLRDRQEELKIRRAESVERAKLAEDEERKSNPKFDSALGNIETFLSDHSRTRSVDSNSRVKKVTFAVESNSSSSESDKKTSSFAKSIKQFLGIKAIGPTNPTPLAFETYRSPRSSSSDGGSSHSSPDSFADISDNVSPAVVIRPASFLQPNHNRVRPLRDTEVAADERVDNNNQADNFNDGDGGAGIIVDAAQGDDPLLGDDDQLLGEQHDSDSSDDDNMASAAQPPNYHGLYTEDPNTWIQNISWYILTTKANNDKSRIAFASMFLRDEAKRWFNSLTIVDPPPAQAAGGEGGQPAAQAAGGDGAQQAADIGPDAPIATFDAFKERFLARFRKNPAELWREQSMIWGVKQRPGQPTEAFLTELQDVAARSRVDEPTIMAAAVAGLRDDVKAAVLQHDLVTLADLRRWSTVYEMCNPPSKSTDVASAVDRLEQIVQKMAVQSITEGPPRTSTTPRVRFNDEEEGPVRRRSPERASSRERDYSPRGAREGWDREVRSAPRGNYYNSARGQRGRGRGQYFRGAQYNRGRGSGGPGFYMPNQAFDGNQFSPAIEGPFRQDQQFNYNQFNCGRCGRHHERGCCLAISSICNLCKSRGHWAICCRRRFQN